MGKVKLARFVYKQEFKLRPGRHELEGKATMREWTQGIKGGPDHYWGAFSLPNILLANSSLFTSQKSCVVWIIFNLNYTLNTIFTKKNLSDNICGHGPTDILR